jgi:hypothetical protein
MKGMANLAPKRMERRGMTTKAEPKAVRALISMAAKMIRNVISMIRYGNIVELAWKKVP